MNIGLMTRKICFFSWTSVGGDFKKIEGSYLFAEQEKNRTIATYRLDIDLGVWAPAFIIDTFKNKGMRECLEALKKKAERQ